MTGIDVPLTEVELDVLERRFGDLLDERDCINCAIDGRADAPATQAMTEA